MGAFMHIFGRKGESCLYTDNLYLSACCRSLALGGRSLTRCVHFRVHFMFYTTDIVKRCRMKAEMLVGKIRHENGCSKWRGMILNPADQ